MKNLIKLEEVAMFLLAILLFAETDYAWWWFPVLLFAPDISMIGYAVNNHIGAYLYNLFHHKGVAILAFGIGFLLGQPVLVMIGAVLFGHASMDRILGYGLKFSDSFKQTHLGKIG